MRRSVWFGFVLLCAHVGVLFGFGYASLFALGVEPDAIPEAPPLVFVALVIAAALDVAIVFVGLLGRLGGTSLREVGWGRLARRDVVLGLVGAAVLVALTLVGLVAHLGSLSEAIERLVAGITEATLRARALCGLIGVVAAFTEETVFRGYLQPAMQRKLGRWGGIVVVALVFAAYHGRFTPVALLGKVAVGLVLAGLRERTGTLWAGALAHALLWAIVGMT